MTTENSFCNVDILNDADKVCQQSIKTVECRLRLTYKKIAETEGNIYFFTTLKSLGLATHDVANFIRKQTIHKRTKNSPDLKVQRAAMQSKLSDAVAYVKRLRRQRDSLKGKLSRQYGGCKADCRRKLESLVKQDGEVKSLEIMNAKAKIDHYKTRNEIDKVLVSAPDGTENLLSNVNVFTDDQKNMVPMPPEPPFICHESIKLSENEVKILSRGPKFMVRDELDSESFDVELEKMVSKKKFNRKFVEEDDISP